VAASAEDSKVAFLFPGQGSQKVGMASALAATDPDLVTDRLRRASEESGLPVDRYVDEGPAEELTRTDVAQPALFSVSLALAEVARELGLRPDFVAGHSLGEYTAAVVSGALGAEEGLSLVCERGRQMAEIHHEHPGAMAAIIGLSPEAVEELCQRASEAGIVAPANLNSPKQIVASGEEAAIDRLLELAEEAGAARALRLQVGAAFHSALMKPVQERLGERMEGIAWRDPDTPLAGNASGEILHSGEDIHAALIAQIASPVRWVDCVRALRGTGVTTFLEVGPGRVLSGLVRQIDPEAEVATADSREALAAFAESHPAFVSA
jgi:[acyl-carrier-protein] S-malonyltransferase